MSMVENHHFIYTNNNKTIERFENPGGDITRMGEIFCLSFRYGRSRSESFFDSF